MATNFAKDIEREIGVLDARRVVAQEAVENIDKKIKYLRGLQELYAPPSPARREKEKIQPPPEASSVEDNALITQPCGPVMPAGPCGLLEPPAISATVMSVERSRGPAATSIPSEGPVRAPTTEQLQGGR